MGNLTPEEIQQARELATYAPKMGYALVSGEAELLARTVLALTEQREMNRRTVTSTQIEAAAKAGHAIDAGDALPFWSWDGSAPSRQRLYRDIARAVAREFGLILDDGT